MVAWLRPAVPRPYRQWTVEECAHYAALRDFELLQLMSRDKRVLATARRLGVAGLQPHSWIPAAPVGTQGAAPPRSPAAVSAAESGGVARHRSPGAARSARRQVAGKGKGSDPESHPHPAAATAADVRVASTATPPQSTAVTAVAGDPNRRRSPGAARNALRPECSPSVQSAHRVFTVFVTRSGHLPGERGDRRRRRYSVDANASRGGRLGLTHFARRIGEFCFAFLRAEWVSFASVLRRFCVGFASVSYTF